jgi:murein DD-endopeptidase MepM/ murein hydrolase activator NlpD
VSAAAEAARWIQHRVIPGERLAEIAERYGVAVIKILQWNALEAPKPLLRAGQKLRIFTAAAATERRRQRYTVRAGDSWSRIARRFDVDQKRLRRAWNAGMTELAPGDEVVVWVDREPAEPAEPAEPTEPAEAAEAPTPAPTALTSVMATHAATAPKPPRVALAALPQGHAGRSVGSPTRGRLLGGVQLPAQPEIYTIRNPENSYGTSLAVSTLQAALADFRQDSDYDRELVVCDMSRARGGRFRPHRSHTSGRDVDIRLPLRKGLPDGTIPVLASQVDWDAAWQLVKSLVDTGQVRYVFLARPRQKPLYQAALRAGESEASLEALIQYPRRSLTAVVRHSAGHTKHIHVRFRCAPDATRCLDP